MTRILAFAFILTVVTATGCSSLETRPVNTARAAAVDAPDALLSDILGDYVRDGRVDYATLSTDPRLDDYVAWLAVTDPDSQFTSDSDRLAFWINAYNAYTLKLICDNYPVTSINDLHFGGKIVGTVTKRTAWDHAFAVVGGTTYTLNAIEHEIIRKRFSEPRIHFALVCAAVSCPPLRAEAYTGDRLDAQLTDQARLFLNADDKNRFDLDQRTARLSRIFDWYKSDFGGSDGAVLGFVLPYLPDRIRADVEDDPAAWRVEYMSYDWALNSLQY